MIRHIAEVGSTNDWVKANAAALADGDWLVADRQSAGRGRLGRSWEAPAGNFTGSALIRPQPGETPIHLLSFVAALALFDACAAVVDAGLLQLKWPNDLLLDGGKLSGILLEAGEGAVVLGIGINLRTAPTVEGRKVATLAAHASAVPAPLDFAELLSGAVEQWRATWRSEGFAAIRRVWLKRAHPVGTRLRISVDGAPREGAFLGLEADGALAIRVDGALMQIHAGDVFAVG